MRLSLGSVVALTAGLLIAFAFWPDNRAVRGPERIVAQEKPKAELGKGELRKAERPKGETAKSGGGPGSAKRRSSSQTESHQPPIALETAPADHPLSSDIARRSKPEARITEALDQAVDFSIEPQALKEALDFIAARYQIPILIDRKALDDANVDTTTEVKLNTPGIPLHDALHLILAQLSAPLDYDVVHGVLMISTVDKINEHLETIVYDCRDLVNVPALEAPVVADRRQADAGGQGMFQFGDAGVAPPAAKNVRGEKASDRVGKRLPFIQMVISATGTEFWDEGTSISELGGLLIVRQNPRVHERIKQLLASIRLMRKDGAFSALNDQYDAEAKKRAAEQGALATRISRIEHEVELLRKESAQSSKAAPAAAPSNAF